MQVKVCNIIFVQCPGNLNRVFEAYLVLYKDSKENKLATFVEGDPKAPFLIATTPRCRGGRYLFPRITPLYP